MTGTNPDDIQRQLYAALCHQVNYKETLGPNPGSGGGGGGGGSGGGGGGGGGPLGAPQPAGQP
jgi:hypothetical protein